jgi:hypothetical protein
LIAASAFGGNDMIKPPRYFAVILSCFALIAAFFMLAAPVHAEDISPVAPEATPLQEVQSDFPEATGSSPLSEGMDGEKEDATELQPSQSLTDADSTESEPGANNDEGMYTGELLPGAGVLILDENFEPVSLAEKSAGEALLANDPWFTYNGIKYSYVVSGCPAEDLDITCFESANPIQAAIDAIAGGKTPSDYTLHFDPGSSYSVNRIWISQVPGLKKLQGAVNDQGIPTVTITLDNSDIDEYFRVQYQREHRYYGGTDDQWNHRHIDPQRSAGA